MGTLTPPYVSGFTRRSWRYQSCLGAPYHHLLGSATSEQTSCGVLPREVKNSSMYRNLPAEPPLRFAKLRLSWVLASQCPASLKGVGVPLITVWPRTTAWLPSAGIRPCFRGISLKPFPASLPKTGLVSCSTNSTQFRGMRMHAWQLLSRRRAPQLHAYLPTLSKIDIGRVAHHAQRCVRGSSVRTENWD